MALPFSLAVQSLSAKYMAIPDGVFQYLGNVTAVADTS
jgi:hypothetical protein